MDILSLFIKQIGNIKEKFESFRQTIALKSVFIVSPCESVSKYKPFI